MVLKQQILWHMYFTTVRKQGGKGTFVNHLNPTKYQARILLHTLSQLILSPYRQGIIDI